VDGEMHLNEYGKIVDEFWGNVALHFPNVAIDVSVVMPNHVHAVIVIKDAGEETSPLQKNRQSRHSVSHQSYQRIKKATTLIGKAFWREMETNWKSTTAIFLNPLQQQAECWE
jgi:REP element-mobilizing transposase RayT